MTWRHPLLLAALMLTAAAPSWQPVRIGTAMVLDAPPGTRFEPGSGDGVQGLLRGPDLLLSLDLSPFADPLTWPDAETTPVAVDGHKGRMMIAPAPDGGWRLGLSVRGIRTTPLGPLALSATARLARRDEASRIEAVLRTIRFLPPR